MTSSIENNDNNLEQQKNIEKERNFRALEAREAKYIKELQQEREEKQRLLQQLQNQNQSQDDDDDSDPYVDNKKLTKTLSKFGQSTQSEIQKAMEVAKKSAKEELKQELWLENNPDFYDVLQKADEFAEQAPKLAESILRMPEGFERQKLVYQNIKALGIDKPKAKEMTTQEKIDANRKGNYYQPTNVAPAAYGHKGDFSKSGQKNAYDQMQELKNRLRLS